MSPVAEVVKLPTDVTVTVDPTLIHQAAVAEAANARAPHGHTKTRGEVRGGGKKPWRQKGTGRARASSIRSPLWAGGGITFGPRPVRNFSVRINRTMRARALAAVVAGLTSAGRLFLLPASVETTKTKAAADALKQLPNVGPRPLLLVTDAGSVRGWRNLAHLAMADPTSVTLRELLAASSVLVTADSLSGLFRRAFGKAEQPDNQTVGQPDSQTEGPATGGSQ